MGVPSRPDSISVFSRWTSFTGTGGARQNIAYASVFGHQIDTDEGSFWLILTILAVVLILVTLIEKSPLGREAIAARDNGRPMSVPRQIAAQMAQNASRTAVPWVRRIRPGSAGPAGRLMSSSLRETESVSAQSTHGVHAYARVYRNHCFRKPGSGGIHFLSPKRSSDRI